MNGIYMHYMAEIRVDYTVVAVTADGSKVQCYKQQYCIGSQNVRSINQGKLKVVKQVNLTQMTIISTTVGKNTLEEMQ